MNFKLSDIRQTIVDSMLKFKHFLFVGNYLKKLIIDGSIQQNSIKSILPFAFEEASRGIEALCGIVVLRSEDSDSFEEVAAYGYEEESFYYSFLSREEGQFDLVMDSENPCIFQSKSFNLYSKEADFALVLRVGNISDIKGFILWEFKGENKEIYSFYLLFLTQKIYSILNGSFGKEDFGFSTDLFQFEPIEMIVKKTSGLEEKFKESENWKNFLISGSIGVGKKSFLKYYMYLYFPHKKVIILNSIPEQIIKLEKSLENWIELSGGGMLAFENIHEFSLGQQRFFYEKFELNLHCTMVFIESKNVKREIYPPFWEFLNQKKINLPDLDLLEKSLFVDVLKSLFRILAFHHRKRNLVLSDEVIEGLKFINFSQNLTELKNILEHAILTTNSENISMKDLSLNTNTGLKIVGSQDLEDMNIRRCVAGLERQKILLANKLFSGNQIRMSKALGISRGSLQYKMKKMELL